jgi:hypothetical protein
MTTTNLESDAVFTGKTGTLSFLNNKAGVVILKDGSGKTLVLGLCHANKIDKAELAGTFEARLKALSLCLDGFDAKSKEKICLAFKSAISNMTAAIGGLTKQNDVIQAAKNPATQTQALKEIYMTYFPRATPDTLFDMMYDHFVQQLPASPSNPIRSAKIDSLRAISNAFTGFPAYISTNQVKALNAFFQKSKGSILGVVLAPEDSGIDEESQAVPTMRSYLTANNVQLLDRLDVTDNTVTDKLLLEKRTAYATWLYNETALTYGQIAKFCRLLEHEVAAIADGKITGTPKNPIKEGILTQGDIDKSVKDPKTDLSSSIPSTTLVPVAARNLPSLRSFSATYDVASGTLVLDLPFLPQATTKVLTR